MLSTPKIRFVSFLQLKSKQQEIKRNICVIFAIKMNVEYFIAKRLFTAKEKNNTHTQPILRIAILAIALSVAVMLISVTVLTGFKNEISSKIIGFGSHITITYFTDYARRS